MWAEIVWLRVINHDSPLLLILGFYCCPAGTGWGFRWGVLTWFVWCAWSGSAAIPRMSWWTSTWGWSPVWHVMVIMISAGVMVSWGAPVMASVMWPGTAYVWIIAIVASIFVRVWLWSWPAMSVPVPVVVSRSWSGAMPCVRVLSLMTCLIVVSYLDSLLLYDHIHCIQSKVHLGNDMQCGLTLGTGSIYLPCWTLH